MQLLTILDKVYEMSLPLLQGQIQDSLYGRAVGTYLRRAMITTIVISFNIVVFTKSAVHTIDRTY